VPILQPGAPRLLMGRRVGRLFVKWLVGEADAQQRGLVFQQRREVSDVFAQHGQALWGEQAVLDKPIARLAQVRILAVDPFGHVVRADEVVHLHMRGGGAAQDGQHILLDGLEVYLPLFGQDVPHAAFNLDQIEAHPREFFDVGAHLPEVPEADEKHRATLALPCEGIHRVGD
jgi:hypothetical protein